MSKHAEEAYEQWRKKHDEECRIHLVVGAKVYWGKYDRIAEGEIQRIDRVRYTSDGREVIDPNGPHALYVAQFGREWESQTYEWKFFHKIEDAKKDLANRLRNRAADARHEAERLETLAATYEKESQMMKEKGCT